MATRARKLNGWRKIAGAVWDAPNDPQIYGWIDQDATALLDWIAIAKAHGVHLTPTHLVGRAMGHALRAVPELNVKLVGSRAVPRESIDVFFITSVARGRDLTGVKIGGIDAKSAAEVAVELRERSQRMKNGEDPDLARTKRVMEILPRRMLRVALRAATWLASDRGWAIPALGLAPSPFGSAMLTSVGMFGLPMGFAPIAWMYRVPVLVLMGEISDKPLVVAGEVRVRPVLPIAVTFDHRYADGAELGEALSAFREYLEKPSAFEPPFARAPVQRPS